MKLFQNIQKQVKIWILRALVRHKSIEIKVYQNGCGIIKEIRVFLFGQEIKSREVWRSIGLDYGEKGLHTYTLKYNLHK